MQIYILVTIFLTGVSCSSISTDVLLAQIKSLERKFDTKIEQYDSKIEQYDSKIEQYDSKIEACDSKIEDLKRTHDSEILELRSKLTAQNSSSFFSVQLVEDKIIAHNGTIPFDRVIVNYGGDYLQPGGIYIAPVDGYYMFTLVVRENGDMRCAGSVVRTLASDHNNNVMLCRAEEGFYDYQTGSCTVIAELLAGDQVTVRADGFLADMESENSYFKADGYTSLTGLLLRAGLE